MVKTQRNDCLFDEQKRSRQKSPNRNDSNGYDLVAKYIITTKNKID